MVGPMKFPNAKAEVQIPAIKAYKSSAVTERFSRADFCAPENEATNNAAVPIVRGNGSLD